jgi:glycerol-3-phosphate cytidylyltransferase-like family protein
MANPFRRKSNRHSIDVKVGIGQQNTFDRSLEGSLGIGLLSVISYIRKIEKTLEAKPAQEEDIKRKMYETLTMVSEVAAQSNITFETPFKKYEAAIFVARFAPAYMNFNTCTERHATSQLLNTKRIFDLKNTEPNPLYEITVHTLKLYEDLYSEMPTLQRRREEQQKDAQEIGRKVSEIIFKGDDLEVGPNHSEYFKRAGLKIVSKK